MQLTFGLSFVLMLVAVLPVPAAADVVTIDGSSGQQIVVAQGKSQVLHIARPFTQALVGALDIADVLPINANTLYVLGKKTGVTNLTLYDKGRGLLAVVDLSVGPDGDGLRRQYAALLPGEPVMVRSANDTLVIEGTLSNSVVVERAVRIAEAYAPGKVVNWLGVGAPQQVMLEVRFSEMQRGVVKQLGIRTMALSNSGNFSAVTGDAAPSNSIGTIAGSFGIGLVNINLVLDALEEKGLVTTLAQPNLIALSGETASFLAGGEFPIPVASTAAAGGVPTVTIEFKQFGVGLAFTPTVLAGGMINLVVAPEVSSLDPTASITLNGISIPGLKTRRARTTLEMRDGQSFAIAGLVRADFTSNVRQVPFLGTLPILGALFRSTNFNKAETELVITVTPHIVRPVDGTLTLPTGRVQAPTEAEQFLLGATRRLQEAPK